MIFAARMQQSQPGSVVAVYTFGSPAVGDAAWAQAYDALGLSSITFRWAMHQTPARRLTAKALHYLTMPVACRLAVLLQRLSCLLLASCLCTATQIHQLQGCCAPRGIC